MLHIINQRERRGSEGRAEQRGGNIMDMGGNEAERERRERRVSGESNVEGERRARCREESRREVEADGGKQWSAPRCQLFSRSVCSRTADREQRERDGRRGRRMEGGEAAAAEEEISVARPLLTVERYCFLERENWKGDSR